MPWKVFVQEVGKANALDPEQITLLEQESMLVIYGFEDPRDFINNISKEVGVDDTLATTLADDIATKVLKPIEQKVSGQQSEQKPPQGSVTKQAPRVPEIPPQTSLKATLGTAEVLPKTIPGEIAHDTERKTPIQQSTPNTPPVNLPTDSNVPNFEKPTTNNQQPTTENSDREGSMQPKQTGYPKGMDPYREPIE